MAKGLIEKIIGRIKRRIFVEKWVMAIKIGEDIWKILDSRLYHWEADPFLVKEGDRYYIFYENLKIGGKGGTLYVGEIDLEKMEVKDKREILRENFHLSYPNVFKIDEKYYMIPESYQGGKLLLYEAEEFPYKWKIKRVLLENMKCVDFTFFKRENIYYCFFSPEKKGDSSCGNPYSSSLECNYTEDIIDGELKPLEEKTVSQSPESSRMGGNFLFQGENIYRLSQDCSRTYGETLNLHQVISVSPQKYQEKFIRKLKKPENTLGMHTYTKVDNLEVIDLFIERNIFKPFKKIFDFKLDL